MLIKKQWLRRRIPFGDVVVLNYVEDLQGSNPFQKADSLRKKRLRHLPEFATASPS